MELGKDFRAQELDSSYSVPFELEYRGAQNDKGGDVILRSEVRNESSNMK